MRSGRIRERFTGRIAGVGSTSGVRIVVGRWDDSPWGSFADVMIEDAAGHRVLLAPDERVREFVSSTYSFDEHVIEPVEVSDTADGWQVATPSLSLRLVVGGRTPLGSLLGLVPARVATAPAWCNVVDPVARVVMRGVRTRGTAGNDRAGVVRRDVDGGRHGDLGGVAGRRPGSARTRRPALPVRLLQHAEAAVGDQRRDDDRAVGCTFGTIDRLRSDP